MCAAAPSVVTSRTRVSAAPLASAPASRAASAAVCRRSSLRATSSTLAPSAQSIRAVSAPMPRLAPVTTHARPFRPRSTCFSSGRAPSGRLDLVDDYDLGLAGDQLVAGALAGDGQQSLALIVAQPVSQAQRHRKGERRVVAVGDAAPG